MATATVADILIHQTNGPLLAAIEVKNREHLTRAIAMTIRISQLSQGVLPEARYFFMVSEDYGYLWKDAAVRDSRANPDRSCSMKEIIDAYMAHRPSRRLSGDELQSVIYAWLMDVALSGREAQTLPELELEQVGFVSDIHNTIVSWSSD